MRTTKLNVVPYLENPTLERVVAAVGEKFTLVFKVVEANGPFKAVPFPVRLEIDRVVKIGPALLVEARIPHEKEGRSPDVVWGYLKEKGGYFQVRPPSR